MFLRTPQNSSKIPRMQMNYDTLLNLILQSQWRCQILEKYHFHKIEPQNLISQYSALMIKMRYKRYKPYQSCYQPNTYVLDLLLQSVLPSDAQNKKFLPVVNYKAFLTSINCKLAQITPKYIGNCANNFHTLEITQCNTERS